MSDDELIQVANTIVKERHADNLVFYLGAGISVQSGIPTFRGWNGMYTLPIRFAIKWGITTTILSICFALGVSLYSSIIVYVLGIVILVIGAGITLFITNRMIRGKHWSSHENNTWVHLRWWIFKYLVFDPCKHALPSDGHCAIKDIQENFEAKNRVVRVETTNIDGLERKANINHVIYNHGRYDRFVCTGCRKVIMLKNMSWIPQRCKDCNIPLRTACVLFYDYTGEGDFEEPRESLGLKKPLNGRNEISCTVGTSGQIIGSSGAAEPDFEINVARGSIKATKFISGKSEVVLPRLAELVSDAIKDQPKQVDEIGSNSVGRFVLGHDDV